VAARGKSRSTGTGNTCNCREQFSLLMAGLSPSTTALTAASETVPTKINSDSSVGVADTSLCGRSVDTLTWHRHQGKWASRQRTCFSVCLQSASDERAGDNSCIRCTMMTSRSLTDRVLMLNLRGCIGRNLYVKNLNFLCETA
jgi:hypothetical protein